MKSETIILNRLQQALVEAKTRNPQISVRSFSSRLGLPAGTVSLVLLGKRRLSKKTALKFASALQFDPLEKKQLELSFEVKGRTRVPKVKSKILHADILRLSADQFHVVRDWYYYAILNLICIPNEAHDSFSMAKRLGLSEVQIDQALERMERLSLIKRDAAKRWTRTHRSLKTTEDIENMSLRYSHHQNLELARDALDKRTISERDFSSLTIPLSSKTLPNLKAKIREWQQEIIQDHSDISLADEVYQIQVQIFPLTQTQTKKEE